MWGIGGVTSIAPNELSGLKLWLDSSDLSTLYTTQDKTTNITVDGQEVGCWADKSGNGMDFIEWTNKPVYKSVPTIRASGSKSLHCTNKPLYRFLHDGTPNSIFIVFKVAPSSSRMGLLGSNQLNNTWVGQAIFIDDLNVNDGLSAKVTCTTGALASVLSNANDYPSNVTQIAQINYDRGSAGDDLELFNNNISVASAESTANIPATGDSTAWIYLFGAGGSSFLLTGDISEVVIYNRVLTSAESAGVHKGLKEKWT